MRNKSGYYDPTMTRAIREADEEQPVKPKKKKKQTENKETVYYKVWDEKDGISNTVWVNRK